MIFFRIFLACSDTACVRLPARGLPRSFKQLRFMCASLFLSYGGQFSTGHRKMEWWYFPPAAKVLPVAFTCTSFVA